MRKCVARATVKPAYDVARHSTNSAQRATRQARRSRGYAFLVNVDTIQHELSPPAFRDGSSRKISSTRLDHAQTLTRLHNVRGLLPRVLAPDSPELAFWNDTLEEVTDQLWTPRRGRYIGYSRYAWLMQIDIAFANKPAQYIPWTSRLEGRRSFKRSSKTRSLQRRI